MKKTFFHPKRDAGLSQAFQKALKNVPKEKRVFIDESGIENNACRQKGWSLRGKRCVGEKNYRHSQRISMIAGLCQHRLQAPMVFEGNCKPSVFETVVDQVLIKSLKSGQIVVLDNINFHKTDKVMSLIKSVGCKLLFLPTYSPDLNPIEHYWFKIKNTLRKKADQFENFFDAVCDAFKNITTSVN